MLTQTAPPSRTAVSIPRRVAKRRLSRPSASIIRAATQREALPQAPASDPSAFQNTSR